MDNKVRFQKFYYQLPFLTGNFRQGCLFCFQSAKGDIWSEASPLPGWSLETFEDVQKWNANYSAPPSIQFALSAAILISTDWQDWAKPRAQISINALIDEPPMEWPRVAKQVVNEGCKALKFKIAQNIQKEVGVALAEVRRVVGDAIEIRLDSNRSLSLTEAIELGKKIKDNNIAYWEEPCQYFEDFEKFSNQVGIPYALDETLRELSPKELHRFPSSSAIILKPTLMGSLEKCWQFVQVAEELGKRSVVSGCYESGVGTWILAQIAARLPTPTSSGLDPYTRLKSDVFLQRLNFQAWVFDTTCPMPEVDVSRLDPGSCIEICE